MYELTATDTSQTVTNTNSMLNMNKMLDCRCLLGTDIMKS